MWVFSLCVFLSSDMMLLQFSFINSPLHDVISHADLTFILSFYRYTNSVECGGVPIPFSCIVQTKKPFYRGCATTDLEDAVGMTRGLLSYK